MKRSGPPRTTRDPDRVRSTPTPTAAFRMAEPVGEPAAPIVKDEPVRSEPYRRLIAALPCAYCGIEGYSQAAHPPPKGKGIKESDVECFPMCCTRPGVLGCHAAFDRYMLISKEHMDAFARLRARIAREKIIANGDWPKSLPAVQ